MVPHVLTRELRVVGRTAGVVIFGFFDLVALCIEAFTRGVAIGTQLIEDIFPLVAAALAGRYESKVEHRAESYILSVLTVCAAAQVDTLVVRQVISTVE